MSIKGQLQSAEVNDWGYARIKVSGTYYGADKKGQISVAVGDLVEFEAYDKAGNNGKTYPTFKFTTIKKVAGGEASQAGSGNSVGEARSGSVAVPLQKSVQPSAVGRDSYWADKEANDKAKDPRISYQASYERAILFTDLAIRNGAFDALAKAKPTARLEILQAFVAEQADHIMGLVYAAKVPSAKPAEPKAGEAEQEADDPEQQESWS